MNRVKEEAQKRRYVNTSNGKVDLHGGKSMTKEQWMKACNEANPLDRYARKQKEFNDPETPIEGLFVFRQDRKYLLLNRSDQDVASLTIEAYPEDDLNRPRSEKETYQVEALPAGTYVELRDAAPEPQKRTRFLLREVEWDRGETWEGARAPKRENAQSMGQLESYSMNEADADVRRV
jgi:hypothetical protein